MRSGEFAGGASKPLAVLHPHDSKGNPLYPDTSGYGHEHPVYSREEFDAVLAGPQTMHRLDESSGEWKRAKVSYWTTRHAGRTFERYPHGGTIYDGQRV